MSFRRVGFTFVEILVAMAVFGVLSAIAVPKYHRMRARAYTAAMKADLGELRIAEEAFWAENQSYSPDSVQLDWRPTSFVVVAISSSDYSDGFQATAQHQLIPGVQCSMYVGRETVVGTPSGEITCGAGVGSTPGAGTPGT